MSDIMGTTVETLVAALKARRAPLPYEMGAFVALQVCEALQTGPAAVRAGDVHISDDGGISVAAPRHTATDAQCAKAVVALLAQMLVAAGPGVPSQLLALVERGVPDMRRLRDEIEATLVPLNRGASRRVLARLVREAQAPRAASMAPGAQAGSAMLDDALDDLLSEPRTEPGSLPAPDPDADLDALLARRMSSVPSPPAPAGGDHLGRPTTRGDTFRDYVPASTPPPPMAPAPSAVTPAAPRSGTSPGGTASPMRPVTARGIGNPTALSDPFAAVDEDDTTGEHPSQRPPPPAVDTTSEVDLESPDTSLADTTLPKPAKMPSFESARVPAPSDMPQQSRARAPAERPASGRISLDGFDETGVKKSRPLLWTFLLVVVLGGLAAGAFALRPDLLARLRGGSDGVDEAIQRQALEHDRQQQELAARHAARFGDLVVRSTPDRAQVLMYVGRGPTNVPDLPMGVAHEFVAIAEGKAPARAVVPVDAQWETAPEGRRFDLAIATPETAMADADLALGDTRLPHEVGTPSDAIGVVRVVTAPAGAKVYQLVGFTPDVRVTDVNTEQGIELIVWLDGYRAERRVIGPSDWRVEDGKKVAEVDVTLEARPARRH